jgi:hypothetical protein
MYIYIYNPFVDHLPVLSVAILQNVSQARDGTQASENAGAMGSGPFWTVVGALFQPWFWQEINPWKGDFLQKRWAIFHRMDFRGPNISDAIAAKKPATDAITWPTHSEPLEDDVQRNVQIYGKEPTFMWRVHTYSWMCNFDS